MIGPVPATQRGAVLAGVNAKPCGRPAAGVDPGLRAAPLEPAAGTRLEEPTQNKIRQSEVSTLSGDGLCGERGFALLTGRWRALQRITVSPSRIGELTQAALVLTQLENGQLRTSC